jgi:HlyD family secretion protein
MKRLAIVLVGVGVLAGGFYAAFAAGYLPPQVTALFALGQGEPAAAPVDVTTADAAAAATQQESVESAPPIAGARVIADAKVVPVQRADLSMRLPGIVREVLVQEGEQVAAGQVLVKLEDALQQVAVAQATANLQRAQANLAQIKAGAREQEVAAAEAALAAAQANYEQLANGAAPGQIEAAQAAVAQAQAGLSQVLEGPSEAALIAVRADVAAAEAQLKQATSAYNQVKERSDIGMLPQSLALQQATIAYEAAQARMNDLMNGATPAQVASANAGVRQAVAQLTTLRNSTPAQIEAAAAARGAGAGAGRPGQGGRAHRNHRHRRGGRGRGHRGAAASAGQPGRHRTARPL